MGGFCAKITQMKQEKTTIVLHDIMWDEGSTKNVEECLVDIIGLSEEDATPTDIMQFVEDYIFPDLMDEDGTGNFIIQYNYSLLSEYKGETEGLDVYSAEFPPKCC